ncbi:MAG: glycerol dehydrogenase [Paenibacillaceae bacterium]|nr:glycerol dehydrogenase [Paenibacillaceae bacterium]
MITSKAPEAYWNESGILEKGGELIAPFSKRPWVLAGSKGLAAVQTELFTGLARSGVAYEIRIYEGYCTAEDIALLAGEALAAGADSVIGIGGGRILDTVKAVGQKLALPVVTVPTVPATCAAWSALSVLYDREGRHTGGLILERSPKLILADTRILAQAPPRYLAAGIADTLVKWYETAPGVGTGPDYVEARLGVLTAKLARDILEELSLDAYRTAGSGVATDAFLEVSHAVLFLAGQVGSLSGGKARAAVAHSIHNSLTQHHETHGRLHGEKVAFGLVAQLFLEGYSQSRIDALAHLLLDLGQPVTLAELGFRGKGETTAREIAAGVKIRPEALEGLHFQVNAALLEQAILDTDATGRRLLEARRGAPLAGKAAI